MLLGVHVHARDEDAVDALEFASPSLRRWTPRQIASRAMMYCRSEKISVTLIVTPLAATSSSASSPARRRRNLDHAVLVPGRPLLASSMYLLLRRILGADGSVTSSSSGSSSKLTYPSLPRRLLPCRKEHLLGIVHQLIRHRPGNRLISHPLIDEPGQQLVKSPGLDQVGDDDRITGRAGASERSIFLT